MRLFGLFLLVVLIFSSSSSNCSLQKENLLTISCCLEEEAKVLDEIRSLKDKISDSKNLMAKAKYRYQLLLKNGDLELIKNRLRVAIEIYNNKLDDGQKINEKSLAQFFTLKNR